MHLTKKCIFCSFLSSLLINKPLHREDSNCIQTPESLFSTHLELWRRPRSENPLKSLRTELLQFTLLYSSSRNYLLLWLSLNQAAWKSRTWVYRSFTRSLVQIMVIRVTAATAKCVSYSVVSDSSDPMDGSLPGSSIHGILQARTLEWVAIPFSRGSS